MTVCALCRRPVRSALARARRIGSGCWRKLRPEQRAVLRRDPARVYSLLAHPVPAVDDQLPLKELKITS
ncbi:hypothetical protein [Streptomyces sp. NPDC048242]|uniref:hypothetical protein n=1 Tax=Streptomyces sp. NPDC048242 TaxID=3155026 RepID=UPI0034493DAE